MVGYSTSSQGQNPLFNWLRENPHRLHSGKTGFVMTRPEDVQQVSQTLDLGTGVLYSEFLRMGQRIAVDTTVFLKQAGTKGTYSRVSEKWPFRSIHGVCERKWTADVHNGRSAKAHLPESVVKELSARRSPQPGNQQQEELSL